MKVPKTVEPDIYSAFRPIMPGEFRRQIPAQSVPISESPKTEVEVPSDFVAQSTIHQSTIDELRKKIADLELQLEEVRRTPPLVIASVPPSDSSPVEQTEKKESKFQSLPVINKPDVTAYWDESQDVRIEVPDKALFMSNTWQLTAEGEETLRTIAAEVRAMDSKAFLDIEGHTDSLMSDPNNPMQKHDISSVKTKEIMDFFVNALRWDTSRVRTSSFGRSRPVADNGTPEGRARNNRIEIVVRSE